MKYPVEFIANGEHQTQKLLRPDNIQKVTAFIEALYIEEQTTYDITANGKEYTLEWLRSPDGHTVTITEVKGDLGAEPEVYDFKQII